MKKEREIPLLQSFVPLLTNRTISYCTLCCKKLLYWRSELCFQVTQISYPLIISRTFLPRWVISIKTKITDFFQPSPLNSHDYRGIPKLFWKFCCAVEDPLLTRTHHLHVL